MNNKINFLPPWVETNLQPAFYDLESGTALQQTARMYAKVNQLIRNVNEQNETIADYIQQFVDLRNFVEDYFNNLDVQDEINNKLDEMVNNGTFELLFAKYINPYFTSINEHIDELDTKVSSLNGIAPTVVTNVSQMSDHEKTYVLTTDGNWYYWSGSAWTVGGVYNSDVTVDQIQWYLDSVASQNNSIFNPYTAVEGALRTSDGLYLDDETYTSTYWVTDYIPLDSYDEVYSTYVFMSFGVPSEGSTLKYYKACIYDENKDFVMTSTTRKNYIGASNDTDITDWKYVRIQFVKADIAFDDRYNMLFTPASMTPLNIASRYTSVNSAGIKEGTIEASRLTKANYINNIYSMLQNGVMPFTESDFGYGTIDTSTGKNRNSDTRIFLVEKIRVPAGTTIELTNDWTALAFTYASDGTYTGRYVSDWTANIYFPVEMETRLVFANSTLGNVNTQASLVNLLTNMSITKDSGKFAYTGEKVILTNTYGAISTGLTMAGQDSAIADDGHIISFTNNGRYKVLDISGQQLKALTDLDQRATVSPHSNASCFGTEKYDADDIYPLVYTNAYNNTSLPKGALYAYRLQNNLTTTLLQSIFIGFTENTIWTGGGTNVRPYGNFLIDTDNNKLYAYTMIDNLHVTRFFKFDLPTLSDGSSVTLQESDIEDYFDVPYFYYIQGGCYFNGKIYASCGFTAADCKLYVVDLENKKVSSTIPLGGFVVEPETVFAYKNELYLSSGSKLYKMKF